MTANVNKKFRLIRIPHGFSGAVVRLRELRGAHLKKRKTGYRTNQIIRNAAVFAYLKTLSTSGKVAINFNLFSNETGLCTKTLRLRISALVNIGWAEYTDERKALRLRSWAVVLEMLTEAEQGDEINVQLTPSAESSSRYMSHIVRWSLGNIEQLVYMFSALEIKENKARQNYMYEKQVQNLRLRIDLERIGVFDRESHAAAQKASFMVRSAKPEREVLHIINADDNRALNTIRAAHNYKSRRSVGYLKKKLYQLQLCNITRRRYEALSADYTQKFHTSYSQASGKRTTYLPDAITLNASVFG
jgi:hypothetical protein